MNENDWDWIIYHTNSHALCREVIWSLMEITNTVRITRLRRKQTEEIFGARNTKILRDPRCYRFDS